MTFNRSKPVTKQIGIGRTVFDDLKKHPICNPLNKPWDDHTPDELRNPDIKVWINPNNQFCFNSMWCSVEDLEQWMEGKGPMVKGRTPEEQAKYWEYAVFEETPIILGEGYSTIEIRHVQWMIKYHWKWFDLMDTDFEPHNHSGSLGNLKMKNPLSLTHVNSRDGKLKMEAHRKIITGMYAPYVKEIEKDLEWRDWDSMRHEMEKEFYGIKRTLYSMGIGYMGAVNTPEEIENLNWINGLVFAKGVYLFLKRMNYPMPDFEWLSNRAYHGNGEKMGEED
jgi:hypothetical protein